MTLDDIRHDICNIAKVQKILQIYRGDMQTMLLTLDKPASDFINVSFNSTALSEAIELNNITTTESNSVWELTFTKTQTIDMEPKTYAFTITVRLSANSNEITLYSGAMIVNNRVFSNTIKTDALTRVIKHVAPTKDDVDYNIGTMWLDDVSQNVYMLNNIYNGEATWIRMLTNLTVFTKIEVEALMSETYKLSSDLTASEISIDLLTFENLGRVYNITDSFTTDEKFKEPPGKVYPPNSSICVTQVDTDVFKFKCLSGYDIDAAQIIFNDETVKDALLQLRIDVDGKAMTEFYEVTIPSGGWQAEGDLFIATLEVVGLKATDTPIIAFDLSTQVPAGWKVHRENIALIGYAEVTADDEITFYAKGVPTQDILALIKVVR
jgi:hypothetical protein